MKLHGLEDQLTSDSYPLNTGSGAGSGPGSVLPITDNRLPITVSSRP